MTNEEIVARALYARRFPDAPVAEHFGWYDNGKHDPESCVHYSNVGIAYKDTRAALTALAAAAPQATDPRDADLMRQELNEISAAIGTVRFMDPPDGGDVSLAEQVRRMREALDKAEEWKRKQAEDIVKLGRMFGMEVMRAELMERERNAAQAENEKLRAALLRYVRNENGCIPDDGPYHAARCTGWDAEKCGCAIEARAALSPPPLSPEKP